MSTACGIRHDDWRCARPVFHDGKYAPVAMSALTEPSAVYQRALDTWGVSAQIDMMIEECGELIVALQHRRRGRLTDAEVASEIADVTLMMGQARLMFGPAAVDDAFTGKLARLVNRLDKAVPPSQRAGLAA